MTSFDGLLSMIKLAGYPITGFFDHRTDQFQVFSRFLAMAEVEFWFIYVINMGDEYNLK